MVKIKEVESELSLKNRLKKDKKLTVCWYCWMWTDWVIMMRREAELLKKNEKRNKMCQPCIDRISNGVRMVCNWTHYLTWEACNFEMVLSMERVQKHLPMAEKGTYFDIVWCPLCSPDQKLHFTQDSLNKVLEEHTKKNK